MSSDYTIGDLLAEPELGLELVSGNAEALRRPVLGAHSIELENPAQWLDRGWMMLTMGVRLRNKPTLQRQLVAELKDIDASCLGVGVGLAFKSVPPALLEEADRLDLPVIMIPEETQFRDIARAVFQSTVGIESATFRRLSSIQQNLVRAFGEEKPLESIVRRLGRLVNSVIAVVTADGETIATTGALPLADILSAVGADDSGFIRSTTVGDWKVIASPINDSRGPAARWLILASMRTSVTEDLARAAMQVTLPLLDALLHMTETTRSQDRAIRQSLLDAMLDETSDQIDRKTLAARVSALGLDFSKGVRVVVVRRDPPVGEALSLPEVSVWLHDKFEQASVRYLLSVRSSELVVAYQAGTGIRELLQDLADTQQGLSVGIGRPASSAEDVRTAWRDAQIAVQHLSLQTEKQLLAFEDLELVTQILAEVQPDRLKRKVDSMAQLLKEQPIQLEALRAYFSHNRNIKEAAAAIFLHPNTLRYRLERFELATGRSLQEPVVIASLYCMLTLMSDDEIVGRD